jgi:ATPase subunit of ABC transporter with duplicated ATPase domains
MGHILGFYMIGLMAKDFVFTTIKLGKIYPPKKQVLKDISLSFYYGAKIGILGLNGAGKSTLLKIMAGVEKEFVGEAFPGNKITVGYLPQEPLLDPKLNARDNVAQGMKHVTDLLKEYEDISAKFVDGMDADEMEKLLNRQSVVQEKIEAANGWELERTLDIAMDALRCPPGDSAVDKLSGGEKRRVALCKLLLEKPDMLLLDEPTKHEAELDFEILTALCVATFGTAVASLGCIAALINFEKNWWEAPVAIALSAAAILHGVNRVRQIDLEQNQVNIKKI